MAVGRLFAYGTLRSVERVSQICGRKFDWAPAQLRDYKSYQLYDRDYPGLVPEPGGRTEGILYFDVDDASLRALDDYEGDEYVRVRVRVESNGTDTEANCYLLKTEQRNLIVRADRGVLTRRCSKKILP